MLVADALLRRRIVITLTGLGTAGGVKICVCTLIHEWRKLRLQRHASLVLLDRGRIFVRAGVCVGIGESGPIQGRFWSTAAASFLAPSVPTPAVIALFAVNVVLATIGVRFGTGK
jgi:hypothetical protein